MNPAVDLREARGRRRMGVCGGRGGVEGPQRRPIVDAAVSAQERLDRAKGFSSKKKIKKSDKHQNGYDRYI